MTLDDQWDEAEQFVGVAAVRDGHDHIARRNHAQVAVIGIEGIEVERGGTGRGQGSSDLRADVTRLTHTRDDDLAVTMEDELHGTLEFLTHAGDEVEDGLGLVGKALDAGETPQHTITTKELLRTKQSSEKGTNLPEKHHERKETKSLEE